MATNTINARDITKHVTLRIKGLALTKLRFRAAAVIFQIGALVAGTDIEIDTVEGSRD